MIPKKRRLLSTQLDSLLQPGPGLVSLEIECYSEPKSVSEPGKPAEILWICQSSTEILSLFEKIMLNKQILVGWFERIKLTPKKQNPSFRYNSSAEKDLIYL